MPGFIDAHNSAGMSQANEQNSVVPFLSVVDSIDPIANYFEECRRNGITSAAVVPGNSTLIGGKAAIVKTGGPELALEVENNGYADILAEAV